MNRNKKKKFLTVIAIVCTLCFLMTACGGSGDEPVIELTDDQKTEFFGLAESAVSTLAEGNTESFREMCADELNEALTEDKMSEIYEQLETFGEFEEFQEADITTTSSNGIGYIVVLQQAKYSEKKLLFTLSFTEDKKLAGIYYR